MESLFNDLPYIEVPEEADLFPEMSVSLTVTLDGQRGLGSFHIDLFGGSDPLWICSDSRMDVELEQVPTLVAERIRGMLGRAARQLSPF